MVVARQYFVHPYADRRESFEPPTTDGKWRALKAQSAGWNVVVVIWCTDDST